MSRPICLRLVAIAILLQGCSGSPGGPMSGRIEPAPQPTGPDPLSNEVMNREAQTNVATVKHILVPAKEVNLALDLLKRVRAGEAMEPLMAEFSKDEGSAKTGQSYEVRPGAQLVFEFKRLGLRLKVGEAAMVESKFGWHVMKRIE
jgi:parvulin-like peptidyl-prolyl isomerase